MEKFERNVAAATNCESSMVQNPSQNWIRRQRNANCIEIILAILKLIRFAFGMEMGKLFNNLHEQISVNSRSGAE